MVDHFAHGEGNKVRAKPNLLNCVVVLVRAFVCVRGYTHQCPALLTTFTVLIYNVWTLRSGNFGVMR